MAAIFAIETIAAGVCWTRVFDMGQRVCGIAFPLLQTKHVDVRRALEELDLHCSIETIRGVASELIPSSEMDESWIVAEPYRNSEQRLAFFLADILERLERALVEIEMKLDRWNRSWNYFSGLNLDAEIANLRHLDMIFTKRRKLFFETIAIRKTLSKSG
jgi:hypothetical protein